MEKYKHYSFDVWLTLIKSNPDFKLNVCKLFYEEYNSRGLSLHEVSTIIREIDIWATKLSERTNMHVSVHRMLEAILNSLNKCKVSTYGIGEEIQRLFLEYSPSFIHSDTNYILGFLTDNGSTLSVTSNTGFVLGKTIEKVFNEWDLYFDFFVWSDECKMSKPNPLIFMEMAVHANKISSGSLNVKDILHIGDNVIADKGCEDIGIDFFQVNSNSNTIKDLLW